MVRVISQETYDEVVKENMNEFEMSPNEAVTEAIAQFEAQGVDLSNIIKDLALGGGDDHLVSTTVTKLKELCSKDDCDDLILQDLEILKKECTKDLARRVRAGKEGAYKLLLVLLDKKLQSYLLLEANATNVKEKQFIVKVIHNLGTLMDTQPDLLDDSGADLIMSLLNNVKNDDILIATLKWASVCCLKHEMNRQRLFAKKLGMTLKSLMDQHNVKLLNENLRLMRRMTLDDDVRVQFGKAHEHARELGGQVVEKLTEMLNEYKQPEHLVAIMKTISLLLVRHDLCAIAAVQGVPILFGLLADNYDNVLVVTQALVLVTALAGNDDVKRAFVKSGIASVIVSLLSRHSSNAKTAAVVLKCIAALTLREPKHSEAFLENGAPEAVVSCMKMHPDDANVQKNGCWAIRNMVARCRDHNSKFHELGVEAILNKSLDKFGKEFEFEVKSALRDLECDVKLDEQWTGKGVQIEE